MGGCLCTCTEPAEPPPELVGSWAADPDGPLVGFYHTKRSLWMIKRGGGAQELSPQTILQIPEQGQTRFYQTQGGGKFYCFAQPQREWMVNRGTGEYRTSGAVCCGATVAALSMTGLQDQEGNPWRSGPVYSFELNGATRLYRIQDKALGF